MKEYILQACAAAAGLVISFFTGLPPILLILLAVMSLDYVTGIVVGIMGRSQKTETGGLSSKAAFTGLLKKVLILAVVALAYLLDCAIKSSAGIEFAAVSGATCLWFVASEGISVIENASLMGVPIPDVVKQALDVIKGQKPPDKMT